MKIKTVCETCAGTAFMPLNYGLDKFKNQDVAQPCNTCNAKGYIIETFRVFKKRKSLPKMYKRIGIKYLDDKGRVCTKIVSIEEWKNKKFKMPPKCAEVLSNIKG